MKGKVQLCLLALTAACWHAGWPTLPSRAVALQLQVTTFALPNGLRVVVVPDLDDPEVRVTMRYAVGEVDDPPDLPGIAHLVEHVLYEPLVDGVALFDRLETDATDYEGTTYAAQTVYTERASPPKLVEMLRLEATRLGQRCATVSDAAFQRQREIVRNELRERYADDGAFAALRQGLYPPEHPLHGASSGTPDSIATITQAQACAFADAHYAPGNAVLVVSGAVTAGAVRPEIEQTLGAIRGTAGAPPSLPPTTVRGRVEVTGPVKRKQFVLAWPLPADPVARARVRAVGEMATWLVDERVSGQVSSRVLGAGDAQMFAIIVVPSGTVPFDDAISGARAALWRLQDWFSSGLYEHAQHRVLYELLSEMTPGAARDLDLAELAAQGRDAGTTLQAELHGLLTLSEGEAGDIAHTYLAASSSTVVVMTPTTDSESESAGTLTHTLLERRPAPPPADPALAHQPAPAWAGAAPLAHVRMRRLPTGLRVFLLPTHGAPTVDIRLVFDAGTADEPAGERGVAMLAGYGLQPYGASANDLIKLGMTGGDFRVDVERDHTTFSVTGLAGYFDELLGGLNMIVRQGDYDDIHDLARRERAEHRLDAPHLAADLAWGFALYGYDHPYARAGIWQEIEEGAVDVRVVRGFREAHYQPDHAMLIIAGGFDPDLADRWIDRDLGDWFGHADGRVTAPARMMPLAYGAPMSSSLLELRIAMPAGRDRAAALVATEMVKEAIADVREQLAASYGLQATLDEHRLSSLVAITGRVDAARAADACALLRDRLAQLRQPSDATASLFVAARHHVLVQLRAPITDPEALADLAVYEGDLGFGISVRALTADNVGALTLDKLAPLLAGFDLSRAAMLLSGPPDAIATAYKTLGRLYVVTH